MKTVVKMNKKSQVFRFCCSCVRETLMKDNCCYFCKGTFVLTSATDDFNIRKKANAESH